MLALATPSHGLPSHNTTVAGSKTQSSRSMPTARRAPSLPTLNNGSRSYVSTSTLPGPSTTAAFLGDVHRSPLSSASSQSHLNSTGAINFDAATSSGPSNSRAVHTRPIQESSPVLPLLTADKQPPQPPSSLLEESIDIHSYPTPDLLRVLAAMLTKEAKANDEISLHNASSSNSTNSSVSNTDDYSVWSNLTSASRIALSTPTSPLTFHARNIPSIPLDAYLLRILRYCPTTNEVFLALLVYFERMSKLARECTRCRFAIDSYNVHRLVIAGVTVASKFFSDVFYTNSRYAKVGGLPQGELNALELQFLLLNDFRLTIPPEEMQSRAKQVIQFSHQEKCPVVLEPLVNPRAATGIHTPSQPLQSMGAFDTFGGTITNEQLIQAAPPAYRNTTPRHSAAQGPAIVRMRDESEERSIHSETDTDAETDDEPTIRPTHSCASSDTHSLFSNDTSEDAEIDEPDDEESNTDDERQTLDRSQHRQWSNGVSSITGDRRMTSQ